MRFLDTSDISVANEGKHMAFRAEIKEPNHGEERQKRQSGQESKKDR